MHLKRWLTALILIPLLLVVILKWGRLGFIAGMLVVNARAHWEFIGMFQPAADLVRKIKMVAIGSLLLLSFCTTVTPMGRQVPLFVLVCCLFIHFLFYLASYEHLQEIVWDLAVNTLGLLYVPLLLGHFIWLRLMAQGEWWLIWLLLVICLGDTLAFYTGKFLGKRKFYPAVSPNKTWAGTVGGLMGSVGAGLLGGHWLLPGVSLLHLGLLSLSLGFLGIVGDLFESMLKRQAEVKDAGSLLPGHGGLLDRLDSLLFAAPALVYARLFILA